MMCDVHVNGYRTRGTAAQNLLKPLARTLGPLQDPVAWYGMIYAGVQITQWDLEKKKDKHTHIPPKKNFRIFSINLSLSGMLGVDNLNFTFTSSPLQLGKKVYFVQNNTNFKMHDNFIKNFLNEKPTEEIPHTEID